MKLFNIYYLDVKTPATLNEEAFQWLVARVLNVFRDTEPLQEWELPDSHEIVDSIHRLPHKVDNPANQTLMEVVQR